MAQWINTLFGTLASHMWVRILATLLSIQLPGAGKQQMMAQVLGSLSPKREILMASLAFGFGLTQCWLLWPFEE